MKKLQGKISTPIILMLVVMTVIIMLIFNITARLYVNRTTANELKNVVENTKTLSAQILSKDFFEQNGIGFTGEKLQKLKVLRSALQVSKYSMYTEIVIVTEGGRVLFPQNYEDTFLSSSLIEKANSKTENTVARVFDKGNKYLMHSETIKASLGTVKMIFIASTDSADGLIHTMNLILIIILIISTFIGVFITVSLSKKLAEPVIKASSIAAKIGNGEFLSLDEKSDCAEINELINGINEMSRKLKASDIAQKTFLQNASHELRTPLMSIQGYAEGISKGIFADTVKTAEIISDESKRLNTLVEELLTLSRIETGSYTRQFEIINLPDAIKDYVQKAGGYAVLQNKNIQFKLSADSIMVNLDEDLLFKAIYNILTNAIKYAKATVNITVLDKDKFVAVKISDDGNGISQTDLPHIFERFYKGKNGNFGLGLAIAKTAVEFMNGSITAYNDNGAVFEILLPKK